MMPKPVRLAAEQETRSRNGVAEPIRKACHREADACFCLFGQVVQPHQLAAPGMRLIEHVDQVFVDRNCKLGVGLLLRDLDAPGTRIDVAPRHPVCVTSSLTEKLGQAKRKMLPVPNGQRS